MSSETPVAMPALRLPAPSCLWAWQLKSTACLRLADRFNLAEFAYAHRGLWSETGPSENSLEALLLAAQHGLGVEFDVRPAADGIPIVFHDPTLDRMTDRSGFVAEHDSADLVGTPLKGGGEILSLEAFLAHWPGETPLLCELKIDGPTDAETFARSVAKLIQRHQGPAAAMSFSPEAVAALPDAIMRGQLIAPSNRTGETDLATTATVDVDYFACHTSDVGNSSLQRVRQHTPLVTWTVDSAAQCEHLAARSDSQIVEGFDPALAKRYILNT